MGDIILYLFCLYGAYHIGTALVIVIKDNLRHWKNEKQAEYLRERKRFRDQLREAHGVHVRNFNGWRLKNPGVYIALSSQGTQLVWNMIVSYLEIFKHFPEFRRNEAYLAKLYALLEGKPPPRKTPFTPGLLQQQEPLLKKKQKTHRSRFSAGGFNRKRFRRFYRSILAIVHQRAFR